MPLPKAWHIIGQPIKSFCRLSVTELLSEIVVCSPRINGRSRKATSVVDPEDVLSFLDLVGATSPPQVRDALCLARRSLLIFGRSAGRASRLRNDYLPLLVFLCVLFGVSGFAIHVFLDSGGRLPELIGNRAQGKLDWLNTVRSLWFQHAEVIFNLYFVQSIIEYVIRQKVLLKDMLLRWSLRWLDLLCVFKHFALLYLFLWI